MNRSLVSVLVASLGLSALAAACAAEEPAKSSATNVTEPPEGTKGDGEEDDDDTTAKDGGSNAQKDAGTTKKDAGAPKKDGGGNPPGPTAFTKQEVQALFNSRCTPCHVGGTSGGMSLATDFTASTVGVASAELPGMKRIQAGNKEQSYLFHKLSGTHLDVGGSGLRMPRSGPPYLADADIEKIGAFIDGL